jgi:hypothetical protein
MNYLDNTVNEIADAITALGHYCFSEIDNSILAYMKRSATFDHGLAWGPPHGRCAWLLSAGNRHGDERGTPDLMYRAGVGVQVAESGEIYLCAAHLVSVGDSHWECIWSDDALCLEESASLENAIQRLSNGLRDNLESAIKKFVEWIAYYQ